MNFEREHDGIGQCLEVGQNYPDLLDARLAKNRGGDAFSKGIRSVLSGTESSFTLEYTYLNQTEQHWFTGKVIPFPDQELGSVIVIHENISEYKRLEHQFRQAVESAPNAIAMVNASGMIVMVNAQTEAYFGYSRKELLGQPLEMLLPKRFRLRHIASRKTYSVAPISRPMHSGLDLYARRKDGTEFPVEIGLSLVDSHEEKLVLSTIIDITERIKNQEVLKASESALKEVQRLAGIGAWIWDIPNNTHTWSEEIYHVYGLGPDLPPIDYPKIQQYFTPDCWVQLNAAMEKSLTDGTPYECDAEVIRSDGTHCWVIARGEAMRDVAGVVINLHGTVQDITERKLVNDKLKETLAEKELLLKEVHHRVKNNLQVLSSLLCLQARTANNEETANVLRQNADRIKSMALIHEKLYQSRNLGKIDFNAYIQSLIENLLFSHDIHSGKIVINMQVDELFLDVNTAIPCGMIINELLSNAFQYAFPGERQGIIDISFKQNSGDFSLVIADDGIGFPSDLDYKNTTSLGLQLVTTLTSQLRGQLILASATGVRFLICFPLSNYT